MKSVKSFKHDTSLAVCFSRLQTAHCLCKRNYGLGLGLVAAEYRPLVYVYVASSLVNKDEYTIYYEYTSVQSVITSDRLGRCYRFVYIYACIAVVVFLLLPFLGE